MLKGSDFLFLALSCTSYNKMCLKKYSTIPILCLAFTIILSGGCSSRETSQMATGVVSIESGPIRGFIQDGVSTYLGIPYAAPPVGVLRWKPPQDVTPWTSIRESTEFSYACPQVDTGVNYGETNEDCLYLNVWALENGTSAPLNGTSGSLPVMVWIHGGAFSAGSGSFSQYDGKELASLGVVVVTINYRLGPLGFLAHAALSAEPTNGVSGNYGLLDQIAALQWVRNNISAFGGNPNNVTIFGESAGAMSVTYLMLSPLAEGLFHRVIAQSGTPVISSYFFPISSGSMDDALEVGGEFADALGCAQESDLLICIRSKSADEIIETTGLDPGAYYIDRFPFFPVVDGWVIPGDPKTLFSSGNIHDVPLIIGTNANEGAAFIASVSTVDDYESWVQLVFGDDVDEILENFPANESDLLQVFDQLYTIALFTHPARFVAGSMANKASKVYLYQLTRIPPTEAAQLFGAYHGLDIPYVFGNLAESEGYNVTDFALSANLMNYWVNFAKTGDPNASGLTGWPEYDSEDQYLEFGDTVTVQSGLHKEECDLLDTLW